MESEKTGIGDLVFYNVEVETQTQRTNDGHQGGKGGVVGNCADWD